MRGHREACLYFSVFLREQGCLLGEPLYANECEWVVEKKRRVFNMEIFGLDISTCAACFSLFKRAFNPILKKSCSADADSIIQTFHYCFLRGTNTEITKRDYGFRSSLLASVNYDSFVLYMYFQLLFSCLLKFKILSCFSQTVTDFLRYHYFGLLILYPRRIKRFVLYLRLIFAIE